MRYLSSAIMFLRWVFSNSGAMARGGNVDMRVYMVFKLGGHPMTLKNCRFCRIPYYSFTKGNKYCGSFACFRRLHNAG